MDLNLRSASIIPLDGGVGGGEVLMVAMEICCRKVAERNVLWGIQDLDGEIRCEEDPKEVGPLIWFLELGLLNCHCSGHACPLLGEKKKLWR
jgi:hypothetical protein